MAMFQYPSYACAKLPLDDFEDPFLRQGLEPRFGLGLLPSDFHTNRIVPRIGNHHHLPTGYSRPWAIAGQAAHDKVGKTKDQYFGADGFQACVDVHHFQPSEIAVKIVENTVYVDAIHEERDDGFGTVQRHFIRRYTLPKEYDMSALTSSISSDGVLTLKAPLPKANERVVPIAHSNIPVQLCITDNKPAKK